MGGPGSGADFLQEDPANPLPNIINGSVGFGEMNSIGISGDLKISGNFGGFTDDFYNDPAQVIVNSQHVLTSLVSQITSIRFQ
jgi:hypothetical protein